jgi:hypothetical protein
MTREAVSLFIQRRPHRVSNCLAPLSSQFTGCPQGQHFRVLCWLLVTLIVVPGSATVKNLTRTRPRALASGTVRRMVRAGYWDATALISHVAQATLTSWPAPADGVLSLIGDKRIKGKTGENQPLEAYTRMKGVSAVHLWSVAGPAGGAGGPAARAGGRRRARSRQARRSEHSVSPTVASRPAPVLVSSGGGRGRRFCSPAKPTGD